MTDSTSLVVHGDCIAAMKVMRPSSVDAVVCDPPYGLSKEPDAAEVLKHWLAGDDYKHRGGGFMGKSWDGFVPGPSVWRECMRVLKPGGYLLAFGGTRTADLLSLSIRLAGFEIRDTLCWMYGSGFPKSMDVSKAIDKSAGTERPVVGPRVRVDGKAPGVVGNQGGVTMGAFGDLPTEVTGPGSPEAEQWQGWGTALKPAYEPIVMARKPLIGTVVKNVLEHGTGAINIDATRIGTTKRVPGSLSKHAARDDGVYEGNRDGSWGNEQGGAGSGHDPQTGRWPANVVLGHHEDCVSMGTRIVKGDPRSTGEGTRAGGFANVGSDNGDGEPNAPVYGDAEVEAWDCHEDCPVRLLDEQSGISKSTGGKGTASGLIDNPGIYGSYSGENKGATAGGLGDKGDASRFFYCAKTSKAEREAGLSGFAAVERSNGNKWTDQDYRVASGERPPSAESGPRRNTHPTVKPVALMRWLVRMVTPPGGRVLDPFMGSGTTGIACALEGVSFVGIDREDEYVKLADARIDWWREHGETALKADKAVRRVRPDVVADQMTIDDELS